MQAREVAMTRAPRLAPFEELGSGQGDDQDRVLARPRDQLLDEVDESAVCPLHVLEHQDRGMAGGRDTLEERAPGPEQLATFVGPGLETEQGPDSGFHAPLFIGLGNELGEHRSQLVAGRLGSLVLEDAGTGPDHLAQGPEGDALAECRGAALMPVEQLRDAVEVLEQLPRQPTLADARLAGDGDDACPSLANGRVVRGP